MSCFTHNSGPLHATMFQVRPHVCCARTCHSCKRGEACKRGAKWQHVSRQEICCLLDQRPIGNIAAVAPKPTQSLKVPLAVGGAKYRRSLVCASLANLCGDQCYYIARNRPQLTLPHSRTSGWARARSPVFAICWKLRSAQPDWIGENTLKLIPS